MIHNTRQLNMSNVPTSASVVETNTVSHRVLPYLQDREEFEWIRAETEALIIVCKEKNLVPSFVSFDYERGKIPVKEPENYADKVLWYLEMNRVYNERLLRYLKHQKAIEEMREKEAEKERREHENKIYEAEEMFWLGLKAKNYSLYLQLQNTTEPHIVKQGNKMLDEYIFAYVYQGKDLFE